MEEIIKPSDLIKRIVEQEFDYQSLLSALKEYKDPQRRRHDLLKKKIIIRVKKGLYIWHPSFAQGTYSKEILANLIYGPSYISLEYALAFWKLIPERVETVTSITFKKDKTFSTSVGKFTYRYLNKNAYSIGINQVEVKNQRFALMASPEKALLDYIALNVKNNGGSFDELLFEDLRIDKSDWSQLKVENLLAYGANYRSRAIKSFCHYIRKEK